VLSKRLSISACVDCDHARLSCDYLTRTGCFCPSSLCRIDCFVLRGQSDSVIGIWSQDRSSFMQSRTSLSTLNFFVWWSKFMDSSLTEDAFASGWEKVVVLACEMALMDFNV